jgi:hypothetical protein
MVEEVIEPASRNKIAKEVIEQEDRRRQLGDATVYKYYFSSVGTVLVVLMIVFELLWTFFSTFPSTCSRCPSAGFECSHGTSCLAEVLDRR